MSPAEWRALISAYLEGRLSADAFKRRYLEAFDGVVARREPVHPRLQDLYFVAEAYGGDPMGRGHDVTEDRDLRAAAAAALAVLPEPAEAPVTMEPAEWRREDVRKEGRRAAFTLGAVGAAGCLVAIAWLTVGILQFFAASAQVQAVLAWGPAPSALAGLVVAFTPIVGSIVAFFGAKDVWQWPIWAAALVFLAAPALTLIGGIDRWSKWRRR